MKQTREQREMNSYTRSKSPANEWEQDFLEGEGGGAFYDELQTYKRLAKRDKEVASYYHEFNKSWYGMGGWDAISELETNKDVQT